MLLKLPRGIIQSQPLLMFTFCLSQLIEYLGLSAGRQVLNIYARRDRRCPDDPGCDVGRKPRPKSSQRELLSPH